MKKSCDPKDIATKAFFLGPQAENADWMRIQWNAVLDRWLHWRRQLFPVDGVSISEADKQEESFVEKQNGLDRAISDLNALFQSEMPTQTPRYLGHMVSETSLPAILGHVTALLHNPNNSTAETSRIGSVLEKETIESLAKLLGYDPLRARGHFVSGGTMANLEAMWRALYRLDVAQSLYLARFSEKTLSEKSIYWPWDKIIEEIKSSNLSFDQIGKYSFLRHGFIEHSHLFRKITGKDFKSPKIIVPASKHYSWPKISALLGLGRDSIVAIELDAFGRMDVSKLEECLSRLISQNNPVVAIVSVFGTTELGAIDPIEKTCKKLEEYNNESISIWHHVDAAYGAYYASLANSIASLLSDSTKKHARFLRDADSITIDPHKLGNVPYACGAIVVKEECNYSMLSMEAPYLRGDQDAPWKNTIEGSRAATGVAATWLSHQTLGLGEDGFGRVLEKGLMAKRRLLELISHDSKNIYVVPGQDLNIVCLSLARQGESLSAANERTESVYRSFLLSPGFSVSKTILHMSSYRNLIEEFCKRKSILMDEPKLVCLRLVLMNPFLSSKELQKDLIQEFVQELTNAASAS